MWHHSEQFSLGTKTTRNPSLSFPSYLDGFKFSWTSRLHVFSQCKMSGDLLSGSSRFNNPLFPDLHWRTDVLYTKDGLSNVKQLVPGLGVCRPQFGVRSNTLLIVWKGFIDALTEWENRKTHANARAKQSYQNVLKHLRSPLVDTAPNDCKDAFYSTLFHYRLIDVIARHKHIGEVVSGGKRTTVPFSSHLVRLMVWMRHVFWL